MSYHHGNYIQCKGKIYKVCQISHEGSVSSVRDTEGKLVERRKLAYIEPLPITGELLKMLGYVDNIETLYFRSYTENAGTLPCFKLGKFTIAQWGKPDEWQVWIDTKDVKKIKYINQLQNLFDAIEGTKLVFTDKPTA